MTQSLINNSQAAVELLFDKKHQLFMNFNDHTDQAKNSIDYLKNSLGERVKKFSDNTIFNYLDVGCGFGNKTLPVIEEIQQYCPVRTKALDPSERLLSIFKETTGNHDINFICDSWEDYQTSEHFHFISSIHTFYYINNWQETITKMLSMLDSNGYICIAIRSNDIVCEFRDYFYKKIFADGRTERNCNELCELLDKLGIRYQLEYVDSTLDIGDCLLENEKGKQLIEFLLRQPYHNLHRIKDEIISYLKQVQENNHLTQRDGYIWIAKQ